MPLRMSRRRFGLWPGGKQSSKQVRRSVAKVPGGTVMHSSPEIPGSALAPGGGGGITCHIKFSQRSRRWGMSPHSNLRRAQQVLTSRLSWTALSPIPLEGSVSLECTHTQLRSNPCPPRLSGTAPSFVGLSIEGSLEDCCRDVGKLKGAWDILLSENEPVLPYSYSDCCSGFTKASRLRAGSCCHPHRFSIFVASKSA